MWEDLSLPSSSPTIISFFLFDAVQRECVRTYHNIDEMWHVEWWYIMGFGFCLWTYIVLLILRFHTQLEINETILSCRVSTAAQNASLVVFAGSATNYVWTFSIFSSILIYWSFYNGMIINEINKMTEDKR